MTKPDSIIVFDRLYLGSLALGAVNSVFSYGDVKAALAATPEAAATGFGGGFIIATVVISFMINLTIWYFVSARASKIAKWILTAFFVIGLLSIVANLGNPMAPQGLAFGIMLVLTVMQGVATYMLFRADAIAWFNNKHIDPGTFR